MTMPFARPGDEVVAGFTRCLVCRLERKHGQDGAVVWARDGSLPHWVPLSSLKSVDTSQLRA